MVRLALAVLIALVAHFGPQQAAIASGPEQSYRLGPQDKLRVKVFEWRQSQDQIYEWAALNADYAVNPAGKLAMPLLGEISAAGMTTGELAKAVGDRLRDRMGLSRSPDVTAEVIEFRPFYIVGDVERPGEYPFRPGMTVMQAFAIAGGKPTKGLAGAARLEREAIATRGEIDAGQLELIGLLARLARLRAEHANAADVEFPPAPNDKTLAEAAKRVAAQERLVFVARTEAFRSQLAALEQLKDQIAIEVSSVTQQLETQKRQVVAVRTELDSVTALNQKGLVIAPRRLALERNLAQVDGDHLRLQSSVMRAKQDISRTNLASVELRARRSSEISKELRDTSFQLESLRVRLATSRGLLNETEMLAPQLVGSRKSTKPIEPEFSIVRQSGKDAGIAIAALETTPVLAGDIVKVVYSLRSQEVGLESGPPALGVAADLSGQRDLR